MTAPQDTTEGMDDMLINPTFALTSAVLYHPDLRFIAENTDLSAGQPSPFYMLTYHQDRMLAAVKDLPGNTGSMLKVIAGPSGIESMRLKATGCIGLTPSKLRFTLDLEGRLECTSIDLGKDNFVFDPADYFPTVLPHPSQIKHDSVTWLVSVSHHQTRGDFTTKHKTTARKQYEVAFKAAPRTSDAYRSEVLVYNELGQIMEGCSTTPYFWRDGCWITPHAECGGNLGTTRRWSLEKSLAIEGIVLRQDVQLDEIVVLSNGVRGFGIGKIVKL